MLILNHLENTPTSSDISSVLNIINDRKGANSHKISKTKLDQLLKLAYENLTTALKSLKSRNINAHKQEEARAAILMSELVTDLVEEVYAYHNPEMTDVIRKKISKLKQEVLAD